MPSAMRYNLWLASSKPMSIDLMQAGAWHASLESTADGGHGVVLEGDGRLADLA